MIRRGAVAALLATTLAACAHVPTSDPEPVIITKEVKVPVPVPCAALGKLASEPAYVDSGEALQAATDIFQQAKLLLAGRIQRIQRLAEYVEARKACE